MAALIAAGLASRRIPTGPVYVQGVLASSKSSPWGALLNNHRGGVFCEYNRRCNDLNTHWAYFRLGLVKRRRGVYFGSAEKPCLRFLTTLRPQGIRIYE